MSSYTAMKINTDKVHLTNEVMEVFENTSGYFWHKFEGLKRVISNNHLEYNVAFNHDYEKAIEFLKMIERCLINSMEVEKIGEIYSEGYSVRDKDIYIYKGKIYMIGFDTDYVAWGQVKQDTYFVSELNSNSKNVILENEECTIKQVLELYLAGNSDKVININTCSN